MNQSLETHTHGRLPPQGELSGRGKWTRELEGARRAPAGAPCGRALKAHTHTPASESHVT